MKMNLRTPFSLEMKYTQSQQFCHIDTVTEMSYYGILVICELAQMRHSRMGLRKSLCCCIGHPVSSIDTIISEMTFAIMLLWGYVLSC